MSDEKIEKLEGMVTNLVVKIESLITKFDLNKECYDKQQQQVDLNTGRLQFMEVQRATSDAKLEALEEMVATLIQDNKDSKKQFISALYAVGGTLLAGIILAAFTINGGG